MLNLAFPPMEPNLWMTPELISGVAELVSGRGELLILYTETVWIQQPPLAVRRRPHGPTSPKVRLGFRLLLGC